MKAIIIFFMVISLTITVHAQANKADVLQSLEQNTGNTTATTKSAARLFGAKDDLTSVIMIIPSGSVVDVLGSDSTYYRVSFEENEGYILKRQAVINEATSSQGGNKVNNDRVVEYNQQAQEEVPVRQNTQSRFSYLEDKYGSNIAARINSGKIWKGMSAEMVKDSWGSPQKINRVISGNTVKEEWIYKNSWLYFQDDRLTTWGPVRK